MGNGESGLLEIEIGEDGAVVSPLKVITRCTIISIRRSNRSLDCSVLYSEAFYVFGSLDKSPVRIIDVS